MVRHGMRSEILGLAASWLGRCPGNGYVMVPISLFDRYTGCAAMALRVLAVLFCQSHPANNLNNDIPMRSLAVQQRRADTTESVLTQAI